MTFFEFEIDEKDLAAAKFLGDTRQGLVHAILEAVKNDPSLSRSAIAKKIGMDKGSLSKLLNGNINMTMRTLADIAWAIGRHPEVHLRSSEQRASSNQYEYTICGAHIAKPSVSSNVYTWNGNAKRTKDFRQGNVVKPVRVEHAM